MGRARAQEYGKLVGCGSLSSWHEFGLARIQVCQAAHEYSPHESEFVFSQLDGRAGGAGCSTANALLCASLDGSVFVLVWRERSGF